MKDIIKSATFWQLLIYTAIVLAAASFVSILSDVMT